VTELLAPHPVGARGTGRYLDAAWYAAAAVYGAAGCAWLLYGLTPGQARGVPAGRLTLDYLLSAACLLLAGALAWFARRDWTARLLAVGLVGTAAAFNQQAHAAGTRLGLGWLDAGLLHGVGAAAYVLALLLFPTGGAGPAAGPDRRIRVLILLALGGATAALGAGAEARPRTLTFVVCFGLLIPAVCGAAQWGRLTGSATPDARQQSRTLLGALAVTFLVAVPLAVIADQIAAFWVCRAVSLTVPAAVLAGLLRFRLPAVELLFNRTLIYGALVGVIGAVYVVGVVRADAWFGLDSDWLAPPQVAAAGLVALAFHPARVRLERWADRLVYGRRVAPYDVLAQVSALSQASEPGGRALVSLARIVAQGLRARYAVVLLDLDDGTRLRYQWPEDDAPAADLRLVPVSYRGAPVGALGLPPDAGRGRSAEHGSLIRHLTQAAGVAVHNARLSIELEHRLRAVEQRAAEIRASRWRIVAAQDAERRELERDLHDGAQPGLTAVRLSLGLVTHLAQNPKQREAAREALLRLRGQIDDVSVSLRQTLRGIAPAALGEHGVTRALRELAESLDAGAAFHVDEPTRAARLAPDIEAAVYFCCAEALQNTAKHCARAKVSATLDLDEKAGYLRFAIADDGPGFDAAVSTGNGMQNMADRIAAVGGVLKIESRPGSGTTVYGSVPISPATVPAGPGATVKATAAADEPAAVRG
jgi:signal transduction histidine kinase